MQTDDIRKRVILIWDLGQLCSLGQKWFQSQTREFEISRFLICKTFVLVRGSIAVMTEDHISSRISYIAL